MTARHPPAGHSGHQGAQFQVGGAVQAGAFYIERKADRELMSALMRGEFCYILAPRQIGKTSLRVRAGKRLQASGVRCVSIDFTNIGSTLVSIDDWYFSIALEIAESIGLPSPELFWSTHQNLTPVHRWYRFLRNELLDRTDKPIVVFIDEVESVLALPFSSDDFFASIRSAFNLRAEDPAYERLTFCLLGVAAPADLISNSVRTPFNIGREIRLEDFSRAELDAFRPGLEGLGGSPDALLDAVYAWTAGHPYMSQRLCDDLVRRGPVSDKTDAERVDDSAYTLFVRNGRTADANLAYAEKRLNANASRTRARDMLDLYRRILSGEHVPAEPNNPVQIELRLTGLAAEARDERGDIELRVRNLVFAEVYDHKWLREREKEQRLAEFVVRWDSSGRHDDYLLRGAALEDALAWSHGRSDLTLGDHEFLLAGLNFARREAEARHRLEEAARMQEQARLAALEEQRKAERERYRADIERERRERAEEGAVSQRRTISILTGTVATLGLLLALTVWQFVVAEQSKDQLSRMSERRSEDARLDRLGADALLYAQQPGKERDALRTAIKAAADALARDGEVPPRVMQGLAAAVATPVQRPLVLRHAEAVNGAHFSHDGTRLLTASKDQTAHLWDAVSGKTIRVLEHNAPVLSASFSRDDTRIFSVGADRIARLWNAATGDNLEEYKNVSVPPQRMIAGLSDNGYSVYFLGVDRGAHLVDIRGSRARDLPRAQSGNVTAIALADGDPVVATGGADGVTRLWDLDAGTLLTELKRHKGNVGAVMFSPLGDRLVTVGEAGDARVWSTAGAAIATLEHGEPVLGASYSASGTRILTWSPSRASVWNQAGKLLATMSDPRELLKQASFSPDERRLATVTAGTDAGAGTTVKLWDVVKAEAAGAGKAEVAATLGGHTGQVLSVRFSLDGSRLLTTSEDNTARLWNSASGQPIATLEGHTAPVLAAEFSPDGARILTVGGDNTARIWDGSLNNAVPTLKGHGASVRLARFSPDGSRIVTTSDDKTARLWDVVSTRNIRTLEGHAGPVVAAVFAGDGSGRLITWAEEDSNLRLWDASTGDEVAVLGHAGHVLGASFSRDGSRIISAGADDTLRQWDATTGAVVGEPWQGTRGQQAIAGFAPGGRYVVLASRDSNTAQLIDAESLRFITDLVGHSARVEGAVFSPDGETVVTISADHTAKLWVARYGSEVATLDPAAGAIASAAFSRDGGRLVLATARDAWVWSLSGPDDRPHVLAALLGHSASLLYATFDGDGRRIVTASSDNTAKLWDAPTDSSNYDLLATLHGHAAAVNHAEFSPDGRLIVTAGRDGRIKLYPTSVADLLRKACEELAPHRDDFEQVEADCRLAGG
ncbi:AAA-like domain-containing protein [Nannocystis sp. SCPEA4]|uniref:AAA-like domain-containing protein n=1 Tax=Nannocystis sp. SCPEA4 TaxID=2996787 RepID=UPI00226E4349|nr:AAA-like domain-containing protein [Nannocystis sp. SCPEA4]MCY1055013.1 AAA-like domain-containing protein [Nannocystis sp. SCPEA4]